MPSSSIFGFSLEDEQGLDAKLVRLDDQSTYVLNAASLIGADGALQTRTVVIRGQRIAEIHAGSPTIEGAIALDCRGKTVLPGLFDLHIHYLGFDEYDWFHAFLRPRPGVRMIREAFEAALTLAHGFTTVRALGHGDSAHTFGLRAAIGEATVRGPRIYHSGWALAPTASHGDTSLAEGLDWRIRTSLWARVDGEDEARDRVRRNIADGAEVTKIASPQSVRPGDAPFTDPELRAIIDESHVLKRRVAAHATSLEFTRRAVEAGIDSIEHGPEEVDLRLLELMQKKGVALVPTLVVFQRVLDVSDEFGYPPALVDYVKRGLEGRRENVRAARDLGVQIGVGSDCGARGGFGYLAARELELLVDSGMTPFEALRAATDVAAKILGVSHELGTIKVGQLAELVVVDGNPLNDIRLLQNPANIARVIQARDALRPAGYPVPAPAQTRS